MYAYMNVLRERKKTSFKFPDTFPRKLRKKFSLVLETTKTSRKMRSKLIKYPKWLVVIHDFFGTIYGCFCPDGNPRHTEAVQS